MTSLEQYVSNLPEVYQPIFGHPELSTQVSRFCDNRLTLITKVYRALAERLGRPLQVLDLGCAQGFFSLHLAQQGASVVGIDLLPQNIDVCNALAAEQKNGSVHFHEGRLENIIGTLGKNQFDLVLGLSVFHHLAHQHGVATVQKLLNSLADNISVGLFEMALRNEPPEWAVSQPDNPRDLLEGYAFVHEMARIPTHLSLIKRPFYMASNTYWFLNDRLGQFSSWSDSSHVFANNASEKTRRYFFGDERIIKVVALDKGTPARCERNLREYANEVAFLENPANLFPHPGLICHGRKANQAWMVRDLWPGALLVDAIRQEAPYDARQVLLDILDQLARLETAGLYHDDVRTWNVLLKPDGHASLIDFGAIGTKKEDCEWPYDLFLSFMIFAREVLEGETFVPAPIRTPSFAPDDFPAPYNRVFLDFLEQPLDRWSFGSLRALLLQASQNDGTSGSLQGLSLILKAYEEAYRIKDDKNFLPEMSSLRAAAPSAPSASGELQQTAEAQGNREKPHRCPVCGSP
ncbi:MAG: class I SAM-dependent methyltransferase [Alphaproteobacteria bacterium]|nr:class I SAM-dependent methyltransferase [Alphaproteobacteria bacterium]